MEEYFTSSSGDSISKDELCKADQETQLDVMAVWFRERFEDPANSIPYETAEGGYQWIGCGPYDSFAELEAKFAGIVPDDMIEKLAEELNGECPEWASIYNDDDYDNYLAEDIAGITEYYQNFSEAIQDIEKLLMVKVDDTIESYYRRLIYVNVITALETYLSDAFISTVLNNPELIQRFVETTSRFRDEKVAFSEVFKAVSSAEQRVRTYLVNIVWHRIKYVKKMYHNTLNIDFPSDSRTIIEAIQMRHDIVHRNGKSKDGTDIVITHENVKKLIIAVEKFVEDIDRQFNSEI